jgi:hypothetical protein
MMATEKLNKMYSAPNSQFREVIAGGVSALAGG